MSFTSRWMAVPLKVSLAPSAAAGTGRREHPRQLSEQEGIELQGGTLWIATHSALLPPLLPPSSLCLVLPPLLARLPRLWVSTPEQRFLKCCTATGAMSSYSSITMRPAARIQVAHI
jgi:hypothetical protein